MNDKKIAFIIAVNNEQYFEECCFYIHRLSVPAGYDIDIIAIREADSMCAAYNVGMNNSDAKYKVYMHQDVMIRNVQFIENIIKIFKQNLKVGMIGMIGGTCMPETGVIYRAWDIGMVDCRDPDMAYYLEGQQNMPKKDVIVEAVDGLLMATQYDITWREDLFTHFDFYDVSQSFEMRKAGYQVLVPYQKTPWVIHDSGFAKLTYYDEERKKCKKEYPQYLYADNGFEFTYDREWNELSELLAEQVKKMIEDKNWEQVIPIIDSYEKAGRKNSSLEMLKIWKNIYEKERTNNFFSNCKNYEGMYTKYTAVRFLLRRMELNMEEDTYFELVSAIQANEISYDALMEIISRAVVDKGNVIKKIGDIYNRNGQTDYYKKCEKVEKLLKDKSIPIAYCQNNYIEQL